MAKMVDIETASHEELLSEYKACELLWGKWSCDSFGFYIAALHKRIIELGGWPPQ